MNYVHEPDVAKLSERVDKQEKEIKKLKDEQRILRNAFVSLEKKVSGSKRITVPVTKPRQEEGSNSEKEGNQ